MGAKTALLCFADGQPADLLRDLPPFDAEATSALITQTNPGWEGTTTAGGSLADYLYPDQGIAYAGVFPGIDLLSDRQVMVERPSQIPAHLLRAGARRRRVILHVMHSGTDWFAFAIWENGTLLRSLSLSPSKGVIEDIGTRLDFERPYWAGQHPVSPARGLPDQRPYPLPFHPLELGADTALRALLGFIAEGKIQDTDIDAFQVPLAGFQVPVANPITQADVQEFMRTHTRKRYRPGPGGSFIPIED